MGDISAPVRAVCAGHILARAHRMGLDKTWLPGQFNQVIKGAELDPLALAAEMAIAAPDEQFIFHLAKIGLGPKRSAAV